MKRQSSVTILKYIEVLAVQLPQLKSHKNQIKKEMEMKKIACAALVAAASMSAVLAVDSQAPAPAPASGANAALPAVGTFIGASLLSFFAHYMH